MKVTGFRRINIEAMLRLIILSGFALFFFMIIRSGKAELYVHPRIVPYMKFGIIAMLLLSIFALRDVFKPQRRVKIAQYLFFILPLFMAFSLPATSMGSTSISFGDLQLSQQSGNNVEASDVSEEIEDNWSDLEDDIYADDFEEEQNEALNGTNSGATVADAQTVNSAGKASKLELQNDMVVVEDEDFLGWIQEIYDHMNQYKEKRIQIKGFVFKNEQLERNEFVQARLMMTCCAADLQPIGFLCRYEGAAELKQDAWVEVNGIIKLVDYEGQETPVIYVESIAAADKPEEEYIYPY